MLSGRVSGRSEEMFFLDLWVGFIWQGTGLTILDVGRRGRG